MAPDRNPINVDNPGLSLVMVGAEFCPQSLAMQLSTRFHKTLRDHWRPRGPGWRFRRHRRGPGPKISNLQRFTMGLRTKLDYSPEMPVMPRPAHIKLLKIKGFLHRPSSKIGQ